MRPEPPQYAIELARAEAELRGLQRAHEFWLVLREVMGADDEKLIWSRTQMIAERHRIESDMQRAMACIRRN